MLSYQQILAYHFKKKLNFLKFENFYYEFIICNRKTMQVNASLVLYNRNKNSYKSSNPITSALQVIKRLVPESHAREI